MENDSLASLGARWKQLNDEYDAEIVAIISSAGDVLSEEKKSSLQGMQKELFQIEESLFQMSSQK